MHIWGDQWFKEHGKHLYEAIDVVEKRMRKWARVGVCGKEKYGTYRDDYFRIWDGSLYQVLFPGKICIGSVRHSKIDWINRIREKLHYWIYWRVDHGYTCKMMRSDDNYESGRLHDFIEEERKRGYSHGFKGLMQRLGITKKIQDWQAKMVNKAFQITCKEYPDVIDELIADTECYTMIKPCKWGDVDGEAIHKKYWKPITPKEE